MHENGTEMHFKRVFSAPNRLKTKKTNFLAPETIKIQSKRSIFETSDSSDRGGSSMLGSGGARSVSEVSWSGLQLFLSIYLSTKGILSALEKKVTSGDSALTSRIARVEKEALDVPAENQLRIAQITENLQMLDAKVSRVGNGGDVGDMKLEIEDIQIRLDRIQNALGGSLQ